MASEQTTAERSTLNRLAALQAGQDQLTADVVKLQALAQTTMIVTMYGAAMALIVYLAIRKVRA